MHLHRSVVADINREHLPSNFLTSQSTAFPLSHRNREDFEDFLSRE
jgi:hypothetical protein